MSELTFERGIMQIPLYKGRREIMTFEGKSLIFIGAHNIDGIRRMIQNLEDVGFVNSSNVDNASSFNNWVWAMIAFKPQLFNTAKE